MLRYLFIGTNDVKASARFYDAILSPLGYEKERSEGRYSFSLAEVADKSNGPGSIHITHLFYGQTERALAWIRPRSSSR